MAVSPSLPPQAARRARANSPEIALLRGHPVFGALEPEQLEQLVSYARTRKVAAGTTLFSKGDPGTELFAVSTGTVKISVPALTAARRCSTCCIRARFSVRSRCSTAGRAPPMRWR
jgi:hypothetical protein